VTVKLIWKEFRDFLAKDPQFSDFFRSWKEEEKKVLDLEDQKETWTFGEGEFSKVMRATMKGRVLYDNELKQRIRPLWDQFIFEKLTGEARIEANKERKEKKDEG